MDNDIRKRALIELIELLRSDLERYKKSAIGNKLVAKTFYKKIKILETELNRYKNKSRRSKRINVGIGAELISGSRHYKGFIKSISLNGFFVITSPTKTISPFRPGSMIRIMFEIPSGEELILNCEIIWLHSVKTQTQGLFNSMGLEILTQSLKYKNFYKTYLE